MTTRDSIQQAAWAAECQVADILEAVKRDPALAILASVELSRLAVKLRNAQDDTRALMERSINAA